jgi:hypothetical protein
LPLLNLEEAEELSGLSSADLLDLVANGVLRAQGTADRPLFDPDEFDRWRRPRLPKRWADLLHIKPDDPYAGLDQAPPPVRRALERFLRDLQSSGDPLIPVPSLPDRLRYVRYSASSSNDRLVLRSWLCEGPSDRTLPQAGWEEDEWE